jgi:phosphoribosylformylglycinamidine synthase II
LQNTLLVNGRSDAELSADLKHYAIALTPDEARQIADLLQRDPTITEATAWGIQGSEHCSYKSSTDYLKTLPVKGEDIALGVGEDAGIVHFHKTADGREFGIAIAHESHNHPSQIVPFEGAATGIGGVCRDVCCMGAKVIGSLDMLRLGDLQSNKSKQIYHGVVSGIAGYANPLGVPNLGGDVVFDEAFNDNCLVNCVSVGLIDLQDVVHSTVPDNAAELGYEFILVGKPTDRSGFGGASFASATLDEDDRQSNKGAVQEPNPFLERHLLASITDLLQKLKEEHAKTPLAMKDLGAGGVLCATVEMVADVNLGATVDADAVHVAEDDLPAAVVLCAETQERFCFAVPPHLTETVLQHFNETWDLPNVSAGARATKIGKVTNDGQYVAQYHGAVVCDAKAVDITAGIKVQRPVQEPQIDLPATSAVERADLQNPELIKKLLAHPNIANRRPITEQYDQTVQGNTLLLREEAETAVFAPLQDYLELSEQDRAAQAAVATGGPAALGKVSPYAQAQTAIAHSVLKLAAVGAKPLALTDCLNYGNPEIPKQMWQFAQGVAGIKEMAEVLHTPFVSGNVSLYNTTPTGSIPPSTVISAVGKMITKARPNAAQKVGNQLVLFGSRTGNLGASVVAEILGAPLSQDIPTCDPARVLRLQQLTLALGEKVQSAAITASGGALTTVLKMLLRGGHGVDITATLTPAQWLSEDVGVVIEIALAELPAVQQAAARSDIACFPLGTITDDGTFSLLAADEHYEVTELQEIWREGLRLYS